MATKKVTAKATKKETTKVSTKAATAENSTKKVESKASKKSVATPVKEAPKPVVKKEEVKKASRETKETLTQYLNDNMAVIKTNKELCERVIYVAKMWAKDKSKVDITTLRSLKSEVEELKLNAKAAASLKKPKATASTAKATAKAPVKEQKAESKAEVKKPPVKEQKKQTKAAEPKAKVVEAHEEGLTIIVDKYVDEFKTEIGTFTKVADIQSYKDLAKAVSEGRDIYLMWYISKKVARTFDYVNGLTLRNIKELNKSWFDNDLDISRIVFISEDEETVVVAVSEYTDCVYIVNNYEIKPQDGVRYGGRLSFEIYELTEEVE